MIANAYPIGPKPVAKIMYPICDIVDAANAFLISSLAVPITAPNNKVITPTIITINCAVGAASKIKFERVIKYTPAVTIVAA